MEILTTLWHRLLGKVQMRASQLKDKVTTEQIKKIIMIPKEIRNAILIKYLQKCIEVHAIAFFQWRLIFPNKVRFEKDLLLEIIEERLEY